MSFRLPSVKQLKTNLGKYDAIVEFTEIAVRDFISQSSIHHFDEFIERKSTEHNIKLNTVDQSIYRSRISQGYILSVYQTAEHFIHEFLSEYNDLFEKDKKLDDSSDDLLIKLLRQISPMNRITPIIGEHRLSVFNYYRIVRNKYSHERIDNKRLDNELIKVNSFSNQIKTDYPNLLAPNHFNDINFDDFILFSRVIKDVSDKLNDFVKPNDHDLKNYYLRLNLYPNLDENIRRKRNALAGHMLSKFGISNDRSSNIMQLMNVPLA